MITLTKTLESVHQDLMDRFAIASSARPDDSHVRGHYAAIDTFLAVASRHNAGMLDAIAPLAQHHRPTRTLAHDHVTASRGYEESLAEVKAKLYGSTYATARPWDSIWADLERQMIVVLDLERQLAAHLPAEGEGPDADLGMRLHRAELAAPTRPHPFIPHQGLPGHVARRIARHVDQFWDMAEGRMVPEPVRHHDRAHQGRLTQYLLADPHLPDEE